jgi:hypothetical protein
VHKKMSKRQFDGLVRSWRKKLHKWDPSSEGGQDSAASKVESSEEYKEEAAFTVGIEEEEESEENKPTLRPNGDTLGRSNGHTRDSRGYGDDSEDSDDDGDDVL